MARRVEEMPTIGQYTSVPRQSSSTKTAAAFPVSQAHAQSIAFPPDPAFKPLMRHSLSVTSASTYSGRIVAVRATADVTVAVVCHHRTSVLLPGEDQFFGHQELATQCATWIRGFLRDCSVLHTPRACSRCPPLDQFIAYILRVTRLTRVTVLYALCLIDGLSDASKEVLVKNAGPINTGHRLLLPALMVSAKFTNDENHNNTSWMIVAQELLPLREVTRAEIELLQICDLKLRIDAATFGRFSDRFDKRFSAWPAEPFVERDMATHRLMDVIL